MEDIIYWIIMIVIMIGGVVSSSNKKKKAREAAARKMQQNPVGEDALPSEKKVAVRKSLSEILEELARENTQQASESYYEEDNSSSHYEFEEMASAEEGGRVTKDSAPAVNHVSEQRIAAPEILLETDNLPVENSRALTDILGGEFDLRRAVIESEILTPRFEKY